MKDPIRETADNPLPHAVFSHGDFGIEDRDLRVEMFTLCEGATEQDGRLSLVGTYESISSVGFPCVVPQITVVLRVRFWPHEGCLHAFRLVLTSPDGKPLGVVLETMAALQSFHDHRSIACNLIARLQDMAIEAPGEHTFDFYVDDRLEGRLPVSFCRMAGA